MKNFAIYRVVDSFLLFHKEFQIKIEHFRDRDKISYLHANFLFFNMQFCDVLYVQVIIRRTISNAFKASISKCMTKELEYDSCSQI